MATRAPILIVGLDGATLDLVEPWAAAGRLPNLAALLERGAWGPLRSTLPAATFPAWTSFMTGCNPGRHGIFDFTSRVPGSYRVRFVNATFRKKPSLWSLLSEKGLRVASIGMPGTYPPERLNGWMVSGFDAPVARGIDGSFVWPPELYRDVRRLAGRLPFADVQEVEIGPDWAATALPKLLDGIERKTNLACHWLGAERWDCLSVVYGESDTIAHHCWRYHDARSPRHVPSPYRHAIRTVYEALDRAIGRLLAAVPRDAIVCVVSDHGSGGAGDRAVHLNAFLRDAGFLAFLPRGASGAAAGFMKSLALRWFPPRLQEWIFRHAGWAASRVESASRFSGIDWSRTMAFSEELDYAPSVWINLSGRDPLGTVRPEDYESLRDRLCSALESWVDPATGKRIVSRAHRREKVYEGGCVDRAPDIVLDLALPGGYSYSCLSSEGGRRPALRRLTPRELPGGRGRGLNGTHRSEGLFVLAGDSLRKVGRMRAGIADLAPTLLALSGVEVPQWIDGRVLERVLPAETVVARAGVREVGESRPQAGEQPYEADEEREIARRLAALGYLDGPL